MNESVLLHVLEKQSFSQHTDFQPLTVLFDFGFHIRAAGNNVQQQNRK